MRAAPHVPGAGGWMCGVMRRTRGAEASRGWRDEYSEGSGALTSNFRPGRRCYHRCAGGAMRAVLARLIGSGARARVGTVISMCGVLLLGYAVGTYFGLTPGSEVVLPPPPALSHPRATPTAAPARATP